jgi:hypothetical protein
VAISKYFTVNQAQTLIEAQSLIEPLNRHFWVGAVSCWVSFISKVRHCDNLVYIQFRKYSQIYIYCRGKTSYKVQVEFLSPHLMGQFFYLATSQLP